LIARRSDFAGERSPTAIGKKECKKFERKGRAGKRVTTRRKVCVGGKDLLGVMRTARHSKSTEAA
jgi:hypothetical protein